MSRTHAGPKCPTCGHEPMSKVKRNVKTMAGGRAVIVKGVEMEECRRCGERLYDLAALGLIRRARERARGTRAA